MHFSSNPHAIINTQYTSKEWLDHRCWATVAPGGGGSNLTVQGWIPSSVVLQVSGVCSSEVRPPDEGTFAPWPAERGGHVGSGEGPEPRTDFQHRRASAQARWVSDCAESSGEGPEGKGSRPDTKMRGGNQRSRLEDGDRKAWPTYGLAHGGKGGQRWAANLRPRQKNGSSFVPSMCKVRFRISSGYAGVVEGHCCNV